MIYLNESFEGGATRFIDPDDNSNGFDVIPRTGSVLLFQHEIYHEGCSLTKGREYCIRTEIMYTSDNKKKSKECLDPDEIPDEVMAFF
jgi:hypothetical protein